MTSLIDSTTIQNYGVIVLRSRRAFRIKHPKLVQSRVVGLFETSLYLGDRTLRLTEAQTKHKATLLPASVRDADQSEAPAGSPLSSCKARLQRKGTLGRFALSEVPTKGDLEFAAKLAAIDSAVLPMSTSTKRIGFTKQVSIQDVEVCTPHVPFAPP